MKTKTKKTTSQKGLITELNCFKWDDDNSLERSYFGVQIQPTKDIGEAITRARREAPSDSYACGYYTDGREYGDGEYHGFWEKGISYDFIRL